MVDNIIRQTSKKTWYKWSMYINILLFLLVAVFVFAVVNDAFQAGQAYVREDGLYDYSAAMFALARDVAILGVVIALIFFQFIRNLMTIMKRSL